MMQFVFLFDASQDADSVLNRWLFDDQWLKTPCKSRVLFDMFTVLVQSGRTDTVQFTPRQSRLQQIRSIHSTF